MQPTITDNNARSTTNPPLNDHPSIKHYGVLTRLQINVSGGYIHGLACLFDARVDHLPDAIIQPGMDAITDRGDAVVLRRSAPGVLPRQ